MGDTTEIRPFRIAVPKPIWTIWTTAPRLALTRWPDELPGVGWSPGVPHDYLKELAAYWADGFDWRKQEARLNELPQSVTSIDGQDIHLLHVRSGEPSVLLLLVTHGWPSSPVEFLKKKSSVDPALACDRSAPRGPVGSRLTPGAEMLRPASPGSRVGGRARPRQRRRPIRG